MNKEDSSLIKEEKVVWLKGKVTGQNATLTLNEQSLILSAASQAGMVILISLGVTGGILGGIIGGLIGGLIGGALSLLFKGKDIFSLALSESYQVSKGIHGKNQNVLEIQISNGEAYKIIVKNYEEWEKLLVRTN